MHSELIFNIKDYKIVGTLGNGSFGQVFLAENINTHQKFAAKVSHQKFSTDEDYVNISTQIEALSKFRNPSVLSVFKFSPINFLAEPYPVILTDYMSNGSLYRVLNSDPNSYEFTITRKYVILLGIALGMQYLHSNNIIHCNLNPENVILDEQYFPHISDFGLLKLSKRNFVRLDSLLYIAPEILEEKEFDSKADVYSYSLIAYTIFTGRKPIIEGPSFMKIPDIIKGKRPDLSMIKEKQTKSFLQKCWSKNPKDRPSFDKIIETLTDPDFYTLFNINFGAVLNYLKHYYPQQEKTMNIPEPPQKNLTAPQVFNVFCLGNSGAGKTSLLSSFINGANHPSLEPTVSPSIFYSKIFTTEHGDVNLHIYDMPGQQKFKKIHERYLKIAHAIIFFTDVHIHEEYKELKPWMKMGNDYSNGAVFYLATTKSDLGMNNTNDELRSFADANNMALCLTSWDDMNTVDKMFNKVASDLLLKYPDGYPKSFE
ncbi:hypothetical protein M9Y10_029537 [Tritrichomonas musculus]|uniref:Protein kinase domain-containing protein n=1 Tax=Tritrichomonas musculus TaxID=1915356 RepID=A0ABR2KNH6_9EUKA